MGHSPFKGLINGMVERTDISAVGGKQYWYIKYLVDASLDTVTFYGDAEPTEPQACSKVKREPQEDIGLQNSHNPKIWKKIDKRQYKAS